MENKINIFKLIFGRIFFVYGMLVFLILFIYIYLICKVYCLFVKNIYKRAIFFHPLTIIWIKITSIFIFMKLKINGKENLKKNEEPYIFISNHRSLLDIALTTPLLTMPILTIGKNSFSKIPFFSTIYKMGSILVDRNNFKSRTQSFNELQKAIENNISVCIYPEGTRNKTKQNLIKFQNGAFKLALKTQKKIVPVVLLNTDKALSTIMPFYMLPNNVEINILNPINTKNFTNEEDLKQHCFEIMDNFYEKNKN